MDNRKYFPGQKYNMLTTISFHHRQGDNKYWLFKCDCGNETVQSIVAVARGRIKSCGCYHRIESAGRAAMQFTKHGLHDTRLYSIWKSMKTRCQNQNRESFKYYGGRGITVHDEWRSDFQAFYDWAMNNGYADNLTLDRKDNDGNYCPENCRWATRADQAYNKRTTAFYEYDEQKLTIRGLLPYSVVPEKTLRDRLKSGWDLQRALKEPAKHYANS